MSLTFTLETPHEWAEFGRTAAKVVQGDGLRYPLKVEVKTHSPKAASAKLDAMMAMVRDICRFYYGSMTVPERIVEEHVEKLKTMVINGKDLWPKTDDTTPDYFTGEVLYAPVSRAKLNEAQIKGIMDWLSLYMVEHRIPSNDPRYRDAEQQYGAPA